MVPLTLVIVAPASAHIELEEPAARYEDQKSGPCGAISDARTDDVTIFEPGQTITVSWRETIDHPSHYRISFDPDGQDDFADPPEMQAYYSNDMVLLDEIPDDPSGRFSVQVTLPDVECDSCTLQLIQVMYDKPPYTVPGNDIYYQCADLVLQRGATGGPTDTGRGPGGTDGTGDDSGTDAEDQRGCGCAGAPAPPMAGLLGGVLVLAPLRRRRA